VTTLHGQKALSHEQAHGMLFLRESGQ
jgi:hypothetical protein